MRFAATTAFLLISGPTVFAAEPCVRTPSLAAQVLYKEHQDFIFSGAPSPPLSEEFARAVKENLDAQSQTGEAGPIDWNYWTNAQDGRQAKNAKVVSVKATGREVQVTLEYKFYPAPKQNPDVKRARVKLSRTSKGCWLIEDVQIGTKSVMSYLRQK